MPAFALGASLSALTVIVTVSKEAFVPSVTATWKVRSVFETKFGAVKLGVGGSESKSVR